MSDFHRQLLQKKFQLAEQAIFAKNEEITANEEESDVLAPLNFENSSSNRDAPFPPTKSPVSNFLLSKTRNPKPFSQVKDIEVPSWTEFFQFNEKFTLCTDNNGVITSNLFNTYYNLPSPPEAPIFILQHGAGLSGLTFAYLVKQLTENFKLQEDGMVPGVLVYDIRGHGDTTIQENNNKVNENIDFSRDSFIKDFEFVLEEYLLKKVDEDILKKKKSTSAERNELRKSPPIILVGHSLGGAVLTEALNQKRLNERSQFLQDCVLCNLIKGLAMFDIVEDTAVELLATMNRFLTSRPLGFRSYQTAIDWHLKSHFLSNRESATVSVPALLKEDPEDVIETGGRFRYRWKCDLKKTEPYWNTWFGGLSSRFVQAPVQLRLLILAGTDNLDKELMIGQMQGKFQLIIFLDSGHFIHEDVPNKTALSLIDFWTRNFKNETANKIPILWGHMRA